MSERWYSGFWLLDELAVGVFGPSECSLFEVIDRVKLSEDIALQLTNPPLLDCPKCFVLMSGPIIDGLEQNDVKRPLLEAAHQLNLAANEGKLTNKLSVADYTIAYGAIAHCLGNLHTEGMAADNRESKPGDAKSVPVDGRVVPSLEQAANWSFDDARLSKSGLQHDIWRELLLEQRSQAQQAQQIIQPHLQTIHSYLTTIQSYLATMSGLSGKELLESVHIIQKLCEGECGLQWKPTQGHSLAAQLVDVTLRCVRSDAGVTAELLKCATDGRSSSSEVVWHGSTLPAGLVAVWRELQNTHATASAKSDLSKAEISTPVIAYANLEKMGRDEFFSWFDNLVDTVSHEWLRTQLQTWLKSLAGSTFEDVFDSLDRFDFKKDLAVGVQQRMKQIATRACCPSCGKAANLRFAKSGNSANGHFQFVHSHRGKKIFHAVTAQFPTVSLLAASSAAIDASSILNSRTSTP